MINILPRISWTRNEIAAQQDLNPTKMPITGLKFILTLQLKAISRSVSVAHGAAPRPPDIAGSDP